MRSLDSRVQKLESELTDDKPVEAAERDPAREAKGWALRAAMEALFATMSVEHQQLVLDDLEAFAAGESVQRSALTLTFLERAARYVEGDARPLTLPPEVASLYLVRRPFWQTLNHECLTCGYDVQDYLAAPRLVCCPLCGGEYEPIEPGEGVKFTRFYKGWSKANPDKVAAVYISRTGGLPW